MDGRINIVLSIPTDFLEKFTHFINNINALNSDRERPVRIRKMYYNNKKEDPIENKIKE